MRSISRGLCKNLSAVELGVLCVALPSSAWAQTSGEAVYGGSPSDVTLSINVTSSVSASCAFSTDAAPNGTYSLGDIEGAYSIDIAFSLRCNSPSRVGIVSDNGGMQAAGVPAAPPGYARLAPYQITLSLAGDQGSRAQATCQSPTLTAGAGGCIFRGPATATAGLRLPGPSQNAPGS